MVRILLADAEPAVRQGLRMCLELESDLRIVGEAGTAEEACLFARALTPDVVVVEESLPDRQSPDVVRDLRLAAPLATVVVLSLRGDRVSEAGALQAGADAYVEKQHGCDAVVRAIRRRAKPVAAVGRG
jgi:DNA-binding NarL/FixJ family response regulator